ncbi:MAG: hypothetical protein V3V32_05415 [Dehalococcoidia bacterium]
MPRNLSDPMFAAAGDSFVEYNPLRSTHRIPPRPEPLTRPPVPEKLPPYSFYGSRTVCSMYEVGSFRLDGEDAVELNDVTINTFKREMKGMTSAAAFVAATGNNQLRAEELLKASGFVIQATWPGNAAARVTFWLRLQRKEEKGGPS